MKEMKKVLLVLIALMGIGFGARAQSCEVGDDTYVAVSASVTGGNQIKCTASHYGSNVPTSGTVYVTVYYVNTSGEEDSEMITIDWRCVKGESLAKNNYGYGESYYWLGSNTNVARIRRWEVSAGACRIERK